MESNLGNAVATFALSGYITAANANEVKQELTTAVSSQDCSIFLVDLDQVEFLDSSGLVALVCAFRLARSLGRRFGVCSLAPSVRIVFELTGLDKVFEIFDNRQAFEAHHPVAA